MPTVALTAKSALALPAREDGARVDYRDQKVAGLILRVTATARTYSVLYRVNGAARRLTLGPADELTLADARERALAIRDQARVGVDAAIVKRAAAAEAQKARLVGETFADLTARYLESAARGDGMKEGRRQGATAVRGRRLPLAHAAHDGTDKALGARGRPGRG